MCSPESEEFSCAESLPIPELFKLLRYSFRQSEYDMVQNILMERENKMKIENETLVRDLGSAKEEVRLLEELQDSSEKHRSKLKENLQNCEMKCEGMKSTISRLIEEHNVSNDKYNELWKEANESDKKIQCLESELKELKSQNIEFTRTIDELRLKERELGIMEQRILKMEEALATILKTQVENLANLVHDADKVDDMDMADFREGVSEGDGAYTVQTPPASQPGWDPCAEIHGGQKNNGLEVSEGLGSESKRLQCSAPHALGSNIAIQREQMISQAGDLPVIVIGDSDDETNNHTPANTMPPSSEKNTRKRTGSKGEYLRNFLRKEKKNDIHLRKHVSRQDEDSADSDDASYSDHHMEGLAAALKSQRENNM